MKFWIKNNTKQNKIKKRTRWRERKKKQKSPENGDNELALGADLQLNHRNQ